MIAAELDPIHLVEIVRRLIRVGVPPTAIANAFEVDPGPIKEVARNLRRAEYGTDELSEAHAFMTWLAYEKLLVILESGPPELQAKVAMQIQSKAMSITARQTPEEVGRAREQLAELIEDIGFSEDELEEAAQQYEDDRNTYVPASDDEAD